MELMIALALGTVIILGVTTLFSDSSRALNDITRAGRQLENSLYAMDLLAKELALVDYWGEPAARLMRMTRHMGRFARLRSTILLLVPILQHRLFAWEPARLDLSRVLSWLGQWSTRCSRAWALKSTPR